MTRTLVSTASAFAAGLVLIGALAGCTGKTDAVHTPKPKPSASAVAKPGITEIKDAPGSGEGLVGALADSKVSTCERKDGAWDVAGTVTNSASGTVKYRIYVSLLAAGGDTRALQQVDVDGVDPSTTKDWSTTIKTDDDGLNCVLRVERYDA